MTDWVVVLFIISTSGNLEYSSIITNSISPVGNGPQKSMRSDFQECVGRAVICTGVEGMTGPVAWQARQFLISCSASLTIPGYHTLDRSNCLVLTMPWWP